MPVSLGKIRGSLTWEQSCQPNMKKIMEQKLGAIMIIILIVVISILISV